MGNYDLEADLRVRAVKAEERVAALEREVERLREAGDRLMSRLSICVNGHPVRDLAETYADWNAARGESDD